MSLFGCRITEVVMSVFACRSHYRGGRVCLCLHVTLQSWARVTLLACRITEVAMSVFTCMSYYRGGHECLCSHVALQRWS